MQRVEIRRYAAGDIVDPAKQQLLSDWVDAHGIDSYFVYQVDIITASQQGGIDVAIIYEYARKDGKKFVILEEDDLLLAYRPVLGEAGLRRPYAIVVEKTVKDIIDGK